MNTCVTPFFDPDRIFEPKSVIKCDTRKTLLLLDGWMDLNQTSTQCSPSGGAFGVCSVFGSGSGSGFYVCLKIWHFLHFLTADPIWTKLGRYVVLVYMNMCVTPCFDPDPDPKTEHNPDAPPLGEHCSKFGSNPSKRLGGVAFFLNCERQTTDGRCGRTIPHMAFGQMG